MAGELILPKQNSQGKIVVTAITAATLDKGGCIAGYEATTITVGAKKYDGTKVYTVGGGFFKVFVLPLHFASALHHARNTGEMVAPSPSVTLPGAKIDLGKVLASKTFTALPAPKK